MPSCAVATCTNTHRSKTSSVTGAVPIFYKFPKDEFGRAWLNACKRKDHVNLANAVICSDHFGPQDIQRNLQAELLGVSSRPKLKPDAIPSLNMPNTKKNFPPALHEREKRVTKRTMRSTINQLLLNSNDKENLQPATPKESMDSTTCPDFPVAPTPENKWKEKWKKEKNMREKLEEKMKKQTFHISQLKQASRAKESTARVKISRLQKTIVTMKNEVTRHQRISSIFSPTQIKKLAMKKTNWTLADVQKCLAVFSVSQKTYRILRNSWKLPIPAERTLRTWLHKCKIIPGIIQPVISLLGELSQGMSDMEKICVLCFDEMSISADFDWDKSTDTIYPPQSKAQVAMISGLCSHWRQPVFYDFDTKMTKPLLFRILEEISSTGLKVKAVVSDLGGTNRELLNELEVNQENSSFNFKGCKIHVFADIPHMIKLLRNHLLDTGWLFNGIKITKETFCKMIDRDHNELRLCPKLTYSTINCTGAERMKVSPAIHLFSTHAATLAKVIYPDEPLVSSFIQDIDDVFDIFNSSYPENRDKFINSGFGIKLVEQLTTLDRVAKTISEMRCLLSRERKQSRQTMLPCQKGLLMSINSLQRLYYDLKENHAVTYILTRRLNQDCLESLFSVIRGLGRTNDNPLPSSFNNRMKIILFGSKLKPPASSNVEFFDDHVSFTTSRLMEIASCNDYHVNNQDAGTDDDIEHVDSLEDFETNIEEDQDLGFKDDVLYYLAGYIANVVKRKYNLMMGDITRRSENVPPFGIDWINKLSRGGLMVPCQSLQNDIIACEAIFVAKFQLPNLLRRENITNVVFNTILNALPSVNEKVVREYVKLRIKIRMKYASDLKRSQKFLRRKAGRTLKSVSSF